MPTRIEWADETWNPITGCTPVSEGCANCYAERMARRLAGRFGYPEAPHHFDVTIHEDRFDQPLRWKKPRRIFVCSMSDFFHPDVPADVITWTYDVMQAARQHTFIVLTKRPERIVSMLYGAEGNYYLGGGDYISNVWHMTTAENQRRADERIPQLLQLHQHSTGWPVLGVSLEPMLGAVDLEPWVSPSHVEIELHPFPDEDGNIVPMPVPVIVGDPSYLDWVILGGESGPGARPMHPAWPRSVRDQCQESGTPFLFKQWGAWWPTGQSRTSSIIRTIPLRSPGWVDIRGGFKELHYSAAMRDAVQVWRVGKKAAGRLLDGREWNDYPEQGQ